MTEMEKKLMAAKALTATTGVMHDIQVHQLKSWAALAFGGSYKSECHIDIIGKTLLYKLTPEGKRKLTKKDLAACVAALDRSVHWLLGDDWALHIDKSGQPLYRGKRDEKNPYEQRKPHPRRK